MTIMDGGSMADSILAAASAEGSRPLDANTTSRWEAFGREIVSRLRGSKPSHSDWAAVVREELPRRQDEWRFFSEHRVFTGAELEVRTVIGQPKLRRPEGHWVKPARNGPIPEAETIRTVLVFVPGLLQDMMRVTGCQPGGPELIAGASITHREDGRPAKVSLAQGALSPSCLTMRRALAMLTIAEPGDLVTAGSEDIVVVLFNQAWMACADG
jgi:hypothetical protein